MTVSRASIVTVPDGGRGCAAQNASRLPFGAARSIGHGVPRCVPNNSNNSASNSAADSRSELPNLVRD
jgi:hypothetical protein